MVNKVILIGHMGSDPEVRRLENGAVVAKFPLATNERYKDKEGNPVENTEWHNIVVWRHQAEFAEKYLKKGRMVFVEGKLTHRKYTDANGVDKYFTEVVGYNLSPLGSQGGAGGNNNMPTSDDEPAFIPKNNTSGGNNNGSAPMKTKASSPKPEEVTDAAGDDLPF